MEINYTLVKCPTREDAERLEESLMKMGIESDESLVDLWEVFRRQTVFKIHKNKIEHQTENFYISNKGYSNWDFVSVSEFMSDMRLKKIWKCIKYSLYLLFFCFAFVCIFILMSVLLSLLPTAWQIVVISIALAVCGYLFFTVII